MAADRSASQRSDALGADDGSLLEARRLTEVERVRAKHLEAQIGLLEERLAATELAGAASSAEIAGSRRELADLRADAGLVVTRATAPLRGAERAIRWLARKLDRAGGLMARRIVFRLRSRD